MSDDSMDYDSASEYDYDDTNSPVGRTLYMPEILSFGSVLPGIEHLSTWYNNQINHDLYTRELCSLSPSRENE